MKSSQTGINFPNNSGRFLSAFQRKHLEKSLEKGLSKRHFQRIQIMLLADEGKTQTQICQELGCSHSTARHWITLAKSGQAHQWNSSPIGSQKIGNLFQLLNFFVHFPLPPIPGDGIVIALFPTVLEEGSLEDAQCGFADFWYNSNQV